MHGYHWTVVGIPFTFTFTIYANFHFAHKKLSRNTAKFEENLQISLNSFDTWRRWKSWQKDKG